MKRILFTVCLSLLCGALSAQTYEESMRYWSDGPLTWDELTLKSTQDAHTSDLSFRWIWDKERVRTAWNTVQYLDKPSVVLDKSISWHNLYRQYPSTLRYDQLLFDLNELYFRRLLTEFSNANNKRSAHELSSFYNSQLQHRWGEIVQDTGEGLDSAMVAFHEKKVAEELAEASYPDFSAGKKGSGFSYEGGVIWSAFCGPAAATFQPGFGATIGMECSFGRHVAEITISVADGTLANDFVHGDLLWKKDDVYTVSNYAFLYKYMLHDGTTFNVSPVAGAGVRQVAWHYQVDDRNLNDKLDGFVLYGGLETTFKFARIIREQNISGPGLSEHGLRLKAFVSKDLSPGGLNAWAFNLGLSYSWSGFTLK